jgi:hypothetical protein
MKSPLLLLLFCLLLSPSVHAQQTAIAVDYNANPQLLPGQSTNTFAFVYTGHIAFTQEPEFPVTVTIADFKRQPVFQTAVADEQPFILSADLPPGGYWITSAVAADKAALYWESQSLSFFINESGKITLHDISPTLTHTRKIVLLRPDPLTLSSVTEKRPQLTWQSLPGAVKYHVEWLAEDSENIASSRGNGETSSTKFKLTEDALPHNQYRWSVIALGKNGEELGHSPTATFVATSEKEDSPAEPEAKDPKKPAPQTPYLGVRPTQISGKPGIFVREVGANSPAAQAGIVPGDILIGLNRQPLINSSVSEFVNLLRSLPLQTPIPIEFLHNGRSQTVQVTLQPKN